VTTLFSIPHTLSQTECDIPEDLRNFDDVWVREEYQVEILNISAASENLYESLEINSAWENIRENMKTLAKDNLGCHRLKHKKRWFDDECSKLIDQRKQAKL
jgi:hypothetical protein